MIESTIPYSRNDTYGKALRRCEVDFIESYKKAKKEGKIFNVNDRGQSLNVSGVGLNA